MLSNQVGKQLGHPTYSLTGWLVSKFFKWHNQLLEENAVKLCNIEPNNTVLELCHGPGFGLHFASQLLTDPEGKLFGVDHSQYMHEMASKRMKEQISRRKLVLYCSNLMDMPIEENTVDKVFHCNCYYFWPDMKAGARVIHRVMKPGGIMVTTLRLDSLKRTVSKKVLNGKKWNPEVYMDALQSSGFTDVRLEDKREKLVTFQAIFATAKK